jgi:hypothetical protein
MTLKTRYQRSHAVVVMLRDLRLRSSNTVITEYTLLMETLLAGPVEDRRAIDAKVMGILALAEERRKRCGQST